MEAEDVFGPLDRSGTAPMRELLATLSDATSVDLRPQDVVIQRNIGGWFRGVTDDEEHVSWRGFNLLLLGRDGRARFYAKCRPMECARAAAERRVHLGLASYDPVSSHVPRAMSLEWCGLGILIMEFVDGPTLRMACGAMSWQQRRPIMIDVLELSAAMVRRAGELGLLRLNGHSGRHGVSGSVPSATEFVSDLTAGQVDELERCIGTLEGLAPSPQHGDLTSGNVMISQGRILLLDLEGLGESTLPVRDAWSLVRSLPATAADRAGGRPWWLGEGAEIAVQFARSCELSREQALAALPVHLADYGANLARRGVPEDFLRPYRSELRRVLQHRLDEPNYYRAGDRTLPT